MKKLLLVLYRAPGDTLAMTALVRDLAASKQFDQIGVQATCRDDIFANNPYITPMTERDPGVTKVEIDYRMGIQASQLGCDVTFLESFHRDLNRQINVNVSLAEPKPELFLSKEEIEKPQVQPGYWVIVAGGKWDMTTKIWSARRYQEVVNRTPDIHWVQVGSTKDDRLKHIHFPLENVTNLIDRTNLRQLISLIYHSDGVLCGVTMAMLIAAAFWKPAVIIAGGREAWTWQAFDRSNSAWGKLADRIKVPHRYLHTIGRLPCCLNAGCLACQVIPPHHDSEFPVGYCCTRPIKETDGQIIPECQSIIDVGQVITAIRSYY